MTLTTLTPSPAATAHTWQSVASIIDHTLLKPEATRDQIVKLCEEAMEYRFACAFVHQTWAALAVSILSGSGVKVGAPAGFPQGASLTTVKRFEAEEALRLGVAELDMVLNIGALKSGDKKLVQADIAGVAEVTH